MDIAKPIVWFGVVAATCALTACGGSSPSSEPAASQPAMTQWDPEDPELTVDEAEQMMAALEETTGASRDEIQVKSIMYSPNGNLTVDAVDPKKPTDLNQYVINIYTDRNDVTPYDYGGADQYENLKATLFPANLVTPAMVVDLFNDSFDRVTGDKAELRGKWVTISQDLYGELGVTVSNGTERDQQTVLYDPAGQFIEVS